VDAARAYLNELTRRVARLTGNDLVGVYAGGSFALDAYEPGRSDLDVAVVVERALSHEEKLTHAAAVRHESIPCPARGLELVVYRREAAQSASAEPDFELNLNTGRAMQFRLDLDPDPDERHWFALDRAILAAAGIAVLGPPAAAVFAPVSRIAAIGLLRQSLQWYLREPAPADDAVLNACRALLFTVEGRWASKPAAGAWARGNVDDAELVGEALAARTSGAPIDPDRTRAFVERTLRRLAE
jgi:hypothetical protein